MKKIIITICCSFLLLSCDKDPVLTFDSEILGEYQGTFSRHASYQTSNVELSIARNGVTGISDTQYYPAICQANYTINGSTITFKNTCFWPAHFDWSLILDGVWQYTLSDKELILNHSNGDKYILTRK